MRSTERDDSGSRSASAAIYRCLESRRSALRQAPLSKLTTGSTDTTSASRNRRARPWAVAPVPAPRSRISLGAMRIRSRRSNSMSRAICTARANSGSPSPARAKKRRTAIRSIIGGVDRRENRRVAMIRRVSARGPNASRADRRHMSRRTRTAHRPDPRHHARPSHQSARNPMRPIPNGICLLCDESAGTIPNLCNACARELPALSNPCITCGASAVPHTQLCGSCAIRRSPVDRTVCALAYAPPVDYLIGRLKFDRDLRVVPALAGMLGRVVAGEPAADWLVPVPLTPARLRERGFNQAVEIARVLGKRCGVRLSRALYRRRGAEISQSSLPDTAARRANVAGVFQSRTTIDGHVAIIDDVVTTGATVNALARCLKRAGAHRVDVWAVARTP